MGQYNVGAPLERIAIDVMGPLPTTKNGNKYLLVVQDYFTKWVEAYSQEAVTVDEVLVQEFVSRLRERSVESTSPLPAVPFS